MNRQILIIDDEQAIREMLHFSLRGHNFKAIDAPDCATALQVLAQQRPDLILLDWMLPDQSGIEFAKLLKSNPKTDTIPIIMLTAKAEEDNKIKGLSQGKVDDYVTKPFSPRELIARIEAVLRRGVTGYDSDVLEYAALKFNFTKREVTIADQKLELSAKLFNLLHFFLTHPNRVYTRQQLLDALAKTNEFYDERSVDRQVKRLRDVLKQYRYEQHIKTIRGHGYQFLSVIDD